MRGRPQLVAAALAALVPVLAACGGGSENAAEPLPKTPTLTVPGDNSTPSVPKRSTGTTGATGATGAEGTDTTTATTPTTTQSNPGTSAGGAAPPQTGGAAPDTQQNDQAPPAGSPADKFEQFCADNPGAC